MKEGKDLREIRLEEIEPILNFIWYSWDICPRTGVTIKYKTYIQLRRSWGGFVHSSLSCNHRVSGTAGTVYIDKEFIQLSNRNLKLYGTLREIDSYIEKNELFLSEKVQAKIKFWEFVKTAIEAIQERL